MADDLAPVDAGSDVDVVSAQEVQEAGMLGRRDEQQQMILLYYCYVTIECVESHAQFHTNTCKATSLNGRIRVSTEGINGVLSGRGHDLREYESKLRHELTTSLIAPPNGGSAPSNNIDLDMKYCHLRKDIPVHQQLFDSLSVRVTREVVSLVETPQSKSKGGRSRCRQRRRQRRKEKDMELDCRDTCLVDWKNEEAATHLSPSEWNAALLRASEASEGGLNKGDVLIDVRNVYESNIGHFAVPNLQTLMPNTRKHSSMADVFNSETTAKALAGRRVFMYCTGGVRCERAGSYLKGISESNSGAWKGMEPPSAVYQLKGGIQNYLEQFGDKGEVATIKQGKDDEKLCLYRGRNFVFDPRRTDPVIGSGMPSSGKSEKVSVVGKCMICNCPHDDYDNNHAPCENKEARCFRCRILVLICDPCRKMYTCWGEAEEGKPILHCGKNGAVCIDRGNSTEQIRITQY
ncbi:hypothetical protein THAOC_36664 [Thalassiosira oceanica]|uniref:Rhodanese domain-containing protein n=2 Tax=Thalassiosira oceanica TaxID=159749 RepID=K0R1J1_THAOC|nr:hypothetical protein THAOC_36664 [Thalassiosira oceanica]|eukprot:EJK44769.1 hypothetical protein THAOC_36664 [Thalassiosira oceanica]